MLNTDLMPGFLGSALNAYSNVPEKLSPQGRDYFIQSLRAMQTDLAVKTKIKIDAMSPDRDIDIEINQERDRIYHEGEGYHLPHYCDYDLGPISFSQNMMNFDMIDESLRYARENTELSDVELFHYLRDMPLSNVQQRKRLPQSDHKKTKSKKDVDADMNNSINQDLCDSSMMNIFTLFRVSQFDILPPFEQRILLLDSRSYFPVYDDIKHDMCADAVYRTGKERAEDPTLLDILPLNIRHFISLYHNFSTVMDYYGAPADIYDRVTFAQMNGYHFNMLQRMSASFEHTQLIYDWEKADHFREKPIQETMCSLSKYITESGYAQDAIDINEYESYFEKNKETARICLYDSSKDAEPCMLAVPDFSNTVYANPHHYDDYMNDNGRKGFDALLQADITRIAERMGKSVPDVAAFREATRHNIKPIIY